MRKEFFLIAFLVIIFSGSVLADQVDLTARINEAQGALSAPGLDIASIFQTDFHDSIDPSSGSLTISQTDLVMSGRNGMDVAITRRYSSNVFLHLSNGGSSFCSGPLNNGYNNAACPDDVGVSCLTGPTITDPVVDRNGNLGGAVTRGMECKSSETNTDASSFKRGKYLGTGWTMNYLEDRYRDPTPLLYDLQVDGAGDVTGGYMTYNYISAKGINSISLVNENSEKQLIMPSMFQAVSLGGSAWFDNLLWGYYMGYDGESGQAHFDDIIKWQNINYGIADGNTEGVFVLYTDSLEPVFVRTDVQTGSPPRATTKQYAWYQRKDGRLYMYDWDVPFCSRFDDTVSTDGFCDDYIANINDVQNWAENEYPGLYVTRIVDDFGNFITVNHKGTMSDPTPFISSIVAPGGRTASFNYYDNTADMDIDTFISYVSFPNPQNDQTLYRVYEYSGYGGGYSGADVEPKAVMLLDRTYVSTSAAGTPIDGTEYLYDYDSRTRELTEVTLPTGAVITYEYAWAEEFPSVDAVRGLPNMPDNQRYPKRVVVSKSVAGGGECPSSPCTWTYRYNTDYSTSPLGYTRALKTTVTDPIGNKVVYHTYPSTTMTLNYQTV